LRKRGILRCHVGVGGHSLFRDINDPTTDDGRSFKSRFAGKIMFG
jgi:hypothetical protein